MFIERITFSIVAESMEQVISMADDLVDLVGGTWNITVLNADAYELIWEPDDGDDLVELMPLVANYIPNQLD